MKKFAKLFVAALAVALIASLIALVPSAQDADRIDPRTLVPASDRVVFIQDPERDADHKIIGEIPGDGSGTSPENPLAVLPHDKYNADDQYPKGYYMTSFYQATEFLRETGGTIVITGPIYLGWDESYGSGNTTKDVFTAGFGKNTIKFTSVYDGVDYRETNGAKIILDTPAEIGMQGQSIWENLDIVTPASGTNRVISFNNWATLVGEGINCYCEDELLDGIAKNYVSLSAGHRYSGGVDLSTNLVVQSGSYNIICAGIWGVNNTRKLKEDGSLSWTNNLEGDTNANLTIEGTTTVYGQVIGTNRQNSDFSGTTTVTINGGKFMDFCEINLVGASGMLNADAFVKLKITGGDFTAESVTISDAAASIKNNPPAVSSLDLSEWAGTDKELAYAFGCAVVFTDIKLPEGKTADELAAAYTDYINPVESGEDVEPVESTPESTNAAPESTPATTDAAPDSVPTDTSTTKAPATTTGAADGATPTGEFPWLIVAIIAVVVVAGVVVVLFVMKKKKASKQ